MPLLLLYLAAAAYPLTMPQVEDLKTLKILNLKNQTPTPDLNQLFLLGTAKSPHLTTLRQQRRCPRNITPRAFLH
jgi:hypothetical protein